MRYKPEHYAGAFVRAYNSLDEDARTMLPERLVRILKKNGDGALVKHVVRDIEKRLTHLRDGLFVQIDYAPSVSQSLRTTLEKAFGQNDTVTSRDVAVLGAGARVVIDDTYVLDCSMKRKVEKLFT